MATNLCSFMYRACNFHPALKLPSGLFAMARPSCRVTFVIRWSWERVPTFPQGHRRRKALFHRVKRLRRNTLMALSLAQAESLLKDSLTPPLATLMLGAGWLLFILLLLLSLSKMNVFAFFQPFVFPLLCCFCFVLYWSFIFIYLFFIVSCKYCIRQGYIGACFISLPHRLLFCSLGVFVICVLVIILTSRGFVFFWVFFFGPTNFSTL